MSNPVIFNRTRVRRHRDRAAESFTESDFLFREIAGRLADRLSDINRTFPLTLELGAHSGLLAEALQGKSGIKTLVQTDLSERMLHLSPSPSMGEGRGGSDEPQQLPPSLALPHKGGGNYKVVADEEFLPFAENTFDMVISAFSMHWINDLPGALVQIRRVLKPDGLFLATLPGGETLRELRHCLEQSELTISGGLTPRISPFIDVRDGGSLLQRAGFAMPVVDSELITVLYADPLKLMYDLRDMGEANALAVGARGFTRRKVLFGALDEYQHRYADKEGRMPATFELVTLTGWKEDDKIIR